MDFTVEPGFKIPPKRRSYSTDYVYPFNKMSIGDSFLISLKPDEFKIRPGKKTSISDFVCDKVLRKASQYRRVDPTFYVLNRVRNMAEHQEVGVRVWRILKGEFK